MYSLGFSDDSNLRNNIHYITGFTRNYIRNYNLCDFKIFVGHMLKINLLTYLSTEKEIIIVDKDNEQKLFLLPDDLNSSKLITIDKEAIKIIFKNLLNVIITDEFNVINHNDKKLIVTTFLRINDDSIHNNLYNLVFSKDAIDVFTIAKNNINSTIFDQFCESLLDDHTNI